MTTSALKKHRVGRADVVIGPYKSELDLQQQKSAAPKIEAAEYF